jgi:hypothetical protein
MRDILLSLTRLVDLSLGRLKAHQDSAMDFQRGDKSVLRVVLTMIHMVGISCHSVLSLTEHGNLQTRDAYPIARSIVEGAINVAFIMASGAPTASRAVRHAQVKAYKDTDRNWQAGGLQFALRRQQSLAHEDVARLESMALEFITSKGREKGWTSENLKERLDRIGQSFPKSPSILLNAAAFNIYRHASEIIHGTYFGSLYFWGLTSPGGNPPNSADDLRLIIQDHQFAVLISVIFAICGLMECLSDYVSEPDFARAVDSQIAALHKLPDVSEALKGSS